MNDKQFEAFMDVFVSINYRLMEIVEALHLQNDDEEDDDNEPGLTVSKGHV